MHPNNWLGKKVLITTLNWFFAPDGLEYKSVYGTLHNVLSDQETLGIKTNSKSTNWYVKIGNMLIAGCQIHYAIQSDNVNLTSYVSELHHEGKVFRNENQISRIYNADKEY